MDQGEDLLYFFNHVQFNFEIFNEGGNDAEGPDLDGLRQKEQRERREFDPE